MTPDQIAEAQKLSRMMVEADHAVFSMNLRRFNCREVSETPDNLAKRYVVNRRGLCRKILW